MQSTREQMICSFMVGELQLLLTKVTEYANDIEILDSANGRQASLTESLEKYVTAEIMVMCHEVVAELQAAMAVVEEMIVMEDLTKEQMNLQAFEDIQKSTWKVIELASQHLMYLEVKMEMVADES